jgi:glutathione synthase
MEYVTSTWLLELAERGGARIFNKPQAIRDHSEKLAIGEFSQFVAPTLVTRDAARLRAFHAEHGDVILKPLDGMGGMGVFRVKADGMNRGSIIEMLSHDGARSVMAQKFIPEIKDGDKRILLIGGQPVPFALARIPQGNEVRGNLAAGGLGVARPLTGHDRKVAEMLGPVLAGRGLLLVGLDAIGDYLTEVNVTSPTCFREIMDQTGFDVAAMFIDALERAAG